MAERKGAGLPDHPVEAKNSPRPFVVKNGDTLPIWLSADELDVQRAVDRRVEELRLKAAVDRRVQELRHEAAVARRVEELRQQRG